MTKMARAKNQPKHLIINMINRYGVLEIAQLAGHTSCYAPMEATCAINVCQGKAISTAVLGKATLYDIAWPEEQRPCTDVDALLNSMVAIVPR